ncbi:hybrid sensor histidine kinase/response regulator [Oceanidesulfovibrio marinus]|uniref:histidine kinase n=1 Tax=Oceanidesulfovibrio marinus TaxID=370038 RepID=A0ABX6NH97_9BACT|nr:response regulator [Oceanidesulfovibrio marinus]QJT09080.1 response regulator [Oceanidesulfovibrio marinus]
MNTGDSALHKKLLQAFHLEAGERLQRLGTQLLALEEKVREGAPDPEEPIYARLVEDIHRELHSLKGASRTVGLLDIEQLCQHAESVMSAAKRGEISLAASSFDVLHAATALVEQLVEKPDAAGAEAEKRLHQLVSMLQALAAGQDIGPRPVQSWETGAPKQESPEVAESLPEEPQPQQDRSEEPSIQSPVQPPAQSHGTDGERRTAEYGRLPGTIRLATEDIGAIRAMAEDLQSTRISLSRRVRGMREAVESLQVLEGLWSEAQYEQSSRIDNPSAFAAQEAAGPNGVAHAPVYALRQADAPGAPVLAVSAVKAGGQQGEAMEAFLEACRTDFSGLRDQLSTLWRGLESDRRELEKQVSELNEAMKQVLLMPIEALTAQFPRMVRDLARQQGKEAICEVDGADIAMDRRILELLSDPFLHVLRNALDHGIETPGKRRAAGKPEAGVVRIHVERQGAGHVRIDVSDDGRGMDVEALRKQAIQAGKIDEKHAREMSREETLGLAFLSDLSTAREVTTISGRGLGMAIVRGQVEQAGGHVGLSSREGTGSTVTFVVPVTLTSFSGVVVAAGGRRFVAPKNNVLRLVRADPSMMRVSGGRKLFFNDGEMVPMANLTEVLSIPERDAGEQEARDVLIASAGGELAAVAVDEVLEEQDVMLKDLGPQLKRVRHIAGVTMLGTGELAPVLQMSDVIAAVARPGARLWAPPKPAPEIKPASRILVVEDSITSRMLLKNVLEAAGYEVTTAVDGMEGFATLNTVPVDLVVSDVEMPRLDGFGLTEKIRAEARHAGLPVVLVTSLESREHKERGLNAGANAYIVKSKFDQSNLLEVIHSLL